MLRPTPGLSALLWVLLLLGCDEGAPVATRENTSGESAAAEAGEGATEAAASPLASGAKDLHEVTDRYEYRVRWSSELAADAGMQAAVRALADDRLQEFLEAANAAPAGSSRWTFKLEFTTCPGTKSLRCIAGDGSIHSGGAHPLPIIERLLYSLPQATVLRPDQLFTDADAALRAISVHARELLLTQRIAQATVSGAAADAAARAAMRVEIASGAEPSAANYRLAEPVVSASGKINALKFLFAPYQVASYAEGTLVAEVPASVFAQWLLPEFADEFVTR